MDDSLDLRSGEEAFFLLLAFAGKERTDLSKTDGTYPHALAVLSKPESVCNTFSQDFLVSPLAASAEMNACTFLVVMAVSDRSPIAGRM
jgi:hypothetical protein